MVDGVARVPSPEVRPIRRSPKSAIAALLLVVTLALSACTPGQVSAWFAGHGKPITAQQAETVAVWANLRIAAMYHPAWDQVAACESGGNWSINTGNGYYGGLQFNLGTWRSNGGGGYPHQASKAEQIRVATNLYNARGSSPWPHCGRYLP